MATHSFKAVRCQTCPSISGGLERLCLNLDCRGGRELKRFTSRPTSPFCRWAPCCPEQVNTCQRSWTVSDRGSAEPWSPESAFILLFAILGKVKSLSHVPLFVTPWTVAYQAPPSMGFSRQEYWSGLPFPSSGNLPHPGIKPRSPALYTDALPPEPPGSPPYKLLGNLIPTGRMAGLKTVLWPFTSKPVDKGSGRKKTFFFEKDSKGNFKVARTVTYSLISIHHVKQVNIWSLFSGKH